MSLPASSNAVLWPRVSRRGLDARAVSAQEFERLQPHRAGVAPLRTRVPRMTDNRRIARALLKLASDAGSDRISVAELLEAFGRHAPAALILLFAAPNILPMPPGTSAILGAPLLLLTAQLALGVGPWLPRVVTRRTLPRASIAPAMRRIAGWLVGRRRLFRPRLRRLVSPAAVRAAAALSSVLALILFLPVPFGNMLPALAISLLALGILRRDGLWILAGAACAAVAVALIWGIAATVGHAVMAVVKNLFA